MPVESKRKNQKLQVIDLTDEIFEFSDQGLHITGFIAHDGNKWFSARIACEILEIKNVSQALTNIPYADKAAIITKAYNGAAPVRHLMVTLPGLFRLIVKSRADGATAFQNWLFNVVLPEIILHGGYIAPTATPEQINGLLRRIRDLQGQLADSYQVNGWLAEKRGAGKYLESTLSSGDRD